MEECPLLVPDCAASHANLLLTSAIWVKTPEAKLEGYLTKPQSPHVPRWIILEMFSQNRRQQWVSSQSLVNERHRLTIVILFCSFSGGTYISELGSGPALMFEKRSECMMHVKKKDK